MLPSSKSNSKGLTPWVALAVLFSLAGAARADLTVVAGSTVNLGGGTADLSCTDVTVSGTLMDGGTMRNVRHFSIRPGGVVLTSGGGAIEVGGNWSNAGSFGGGTSSVLFSDVCGLPSASVAGSTTFSSVAFSSGTGKHYVLQSGATQTISAALQVLGTAGQPIQFVSSVAGGVANINLQPGATQQIQQVGVTDVWATGQWLAPYQSNQGGGGNANRWFGVPSNAVAEPIPTLSECLVAALAALTAAIGGLSLRRRPVAARPRFRKEGESR
jgi:hypothetical protein